jgi:DNA-binding NarL/FixJ family response regulator
MTTKRLRVLHVDDNDDARTLLSVLISQEEDLEEVGSHHNADRLPQLIQETVPDVLLIDLTMPGKDPIEAIQEVRAAFPALRIVAVSGSVDPRLLARAQAAGVSQLARKTCDIAETLEVIRGSR